MSNTKEMESDFEAWCREVTGVCGIHKQFAWRVWQAATALANRKHQSALHAAERRHSASQIVTGRCSPDCPTKISEGQGICYSAFCALKHAEPLDMDEERIDRIGQNGNDGLHYGCGKKLAKGQYWDFCGETDMGQTLPALCKGCGGKYELDRGTNDE